jgi:hypothetical protein
MANRFLVSGGNGDYDSTTNWSTTSGGASGASFPLIGDDIIIDANSLNAPLNINVVSACKSFTASNYTGTISMLSNLSVNGTTNTGNITLSAGMVITGVGNFIKVFTGTTGTITSNGVVFDCNFIFQAAAATTTTITGAMQVNGNITWSLNSTDINTINSGTISVGGDIIHNSPVAGTSPLQMIGSTTATITQVATRYLQTNLIINKGAGSFNQVDLYWGTNGRTLTYTSGLVNHTGVLYLTTSVLNTNGMTWNTIVYATSGSTSLTLTSTLLADSINSGVSPASASFLGTHGFIVNNFSYTVANSFTLTFTAGKTYTINNSIIISSTSAPVNWRTGTLVAANINLGSNAFMKVYNVAITSIAATNKTIRAYSSTVTTCVNVFRLTSNIKSYSTTR